MGIDVMGKWEWEYSVGMGWVGMGIDVMGKWEWECSVEWDGWEWE